MSMNISIQQSKTISKQAHILHESPFFDAQMKRKTLHIGLIQTLHSFLVPKRPRSRHSEATPVVALQSEPLTGLVFHLPSPIVSSTGVTGSAIKQPVEKRWKKNMYDRDFLKDVWHFLSTKNCGVYPLSEATSPITVSEGVRCVWKWCECSEGSISNGNIHSDHCNQGFRAIAGKTRIMWSFRSLESQRLWVETSPPKLGGGDNHMNPFF